MTLLLKHQTVQAFVTRVREAYRQGDRETLLKVSRFILARIQAGDLTDAQVRTAFGLTNAQWTALKTRMQNYLNADNTLRSAVGE